MAHELYVLMQGAVDVSVPRGGGQEAVSDAAARQRGAVGGSSMKHVAVQHAP